MTVTSEEELKMIKDEIAWSQKIAEEKRDDLEKSQYRYEQACLRVRSLVFALDDFYMNNPKYKNEGQAQ